MKIVHIGLAVLGAVVAGFAALMFSAARSDFIFRGCHEIPHPEWQFTANCADASFAIRSFGTITILALLVSGWSVWRLRRE